MSKPFDRARYLAEAGISDSQNILTPEERMAAEEADLSRSEIARTLFSFFDSMDAASESTGEEREHHLLEASQVMRTHPQLKIDLLTFAGILGDDSVIEEIQDQLIMAADPYTGIVPDDFELPSELQKYFDQSDDLQEFRDSLPDLLGVKLVSKHDRARAALKESAAEVITQFSVHSPMYAAEVTTWHTPLWRTALGTDQVFQWRDMRSSMRTRSDDDQSWRASERRGNIEGSRWMLERRLVAIRDTNTWRVEFRLVLPEDSGDIYAHYNTWDVQVLSGEAELSVSESLYDEEVRELDGKFTEEQLQTHRVIVTRYPE